MSSPEVFEKQPDGNFGYIATDQQAAEQLATRAGHAGASVSISPYISDITPGVMVIVPAKDKDLLRKAGFKTKEPIVPLDKPSERVPSSDDAVGMAANVPPSLRFRGDANS